MLSYRPKCTVCLEWCKALMCKTDVIFSLFVWYISPTGHLSFHCSSITKQTQENNKMSPDIIHFLHIYTLPFDIFICFIFVNLHVLHLFLQYTKIKNKLEALRERRPPWPRQIITLILPTVKMLSLGCERLPTPLKKKKKKKKKKKRKKGSESLPAPRSGYATTITVFFCSFTHPTIPRSPPKFNQFFLVLLRTRPQNFIPIRL